MFNTGKFTAAAGALALVVSSSVVHAKPAAPQAGLEAMLPMIEMQVAVLSPVFTNLCVAGAQGCVLPLRNAKPPVAAPLPSAPAVPVAPAAPVAAAGAAGGGIGSFWLVGALAALAGVGFLVADNGDDSPGG